MKNLLSYLSESFFKNVGVDNYLTNAITKGQDNITLVGRDILKGKFKSNTAAEITKLSPTAIHVKILKGVKYPKKEFDIDFSDYEKFIKDIAEGDFLNPSLEVSWYIDTVSYKPVFLLNFSNRNTYRELFLKYNIITDTLEKGM